MLTLQDFSPRKGFLFCVDSDGCVFDTMEIKHKECFCPAFIKVFGLQPISKYVREAWEYGNLYSVHRGRSRFIEILLVFDWLAERVAAQGYSYDRLIFNADGSVNMDASRRVEIGFTLKMN